MTSAVVQSLTRCMDKESMTASRQLQLGHP